MKNRVFDISIDDMSKEGEGIGHNNGYTLFVKDAVIGDRVRVSVIKEKKHYGYAKLQEILQPSPLRKDAPCPIAKKCGGCQLMAMSYEGQLEFKQKLVRDALIHIGGFRNIPVNDIAGMEYPFRYRNKSQYPVKEKDGKIIAGFYGRHSHNIMESDDCLIGSKKSREVLGRITGIMEHYGISPYDEKTGKGILRHIIMRESKYNGDMTVCLVINAKKLPHEDEIAESIYGTGGISGVCINSNLSKDNVILGKGLRCIKGEPYITDKIGDVKYRISPLSFYQVNPLQTRVLYDTVKSFAALNGNETVWDLYCGIGSISLYLAAGAGRIIGVDVVPEAIEDAKRNAALNGIENAHYYMGKAEEIIPDLINRKLPELKEKENVVIVDPPRKGCAEELLDAIVKLAPEKVIYVSCDPATLARDLRILADKGYEIKEIQPVDMFPMTVHVETVCLLSNRKPDARVKIDVDLEDYYRIKDEQKKNKASE